MPLALQHLEQYRAALRLEAWFDLSGRTKVQITGADRAAFLHNFCTNDIKNLPTGRGCEAFLCTGKGKTLAYVRVFALRDALWLDAAPGLGTAIVQHLERYFISEDVAIVDRSAQYTHFLMAGPDEVELQAWGFDSLSDLACLTDTPPPFENGMVWRADILSVPCHHLICPRGALNEEMKKLDPVKYVQASRECYEILRIEAGMPEYGQDIDESNYPQEVGRDSQTISFTKGCYLGQEPIVMIRDRGQVSRLLVGLKLPGNEPLAPGTPLTHDGKEVGKTTSSVWSPLMNGPIALGYVRRGLTEPGSKVQVSGIAGDAIVTKLPFAAE